MEKEWNDLLFAVRLSIRYHSKRAAFFGFLTKSVTALSLILGSGTAAIAYQSNYMLSMAFGGIISFASIISLVFRFSPNEQLHTDLCRKFCELEKSMIRQKAPNEDLLNEKTAERLEIEAGEPEPLRTLGLVCHNELVISQGYGNLYKLGCIRSLLRQFDLPFLKIEREKFINWQQEEKADLIASPA